MHDNDFEMFSDIWGLFKKYREPSNDEDNIKNFRAESGVIAQSYKTEFCNELLKTVAQECFRRSTILNNN